MSNWIVDFLNVLASLATVVSVIFLAFQIRAEAKIAKTALTFEMITKLENFVTQNHAECIYQIIGYPDSPSSDVETILQEHDRELYDALNFFERLSIASKIDAINTSVLMQMYGIRIKQAYEKLDPYIETIQAREGPAHGRSKQNVPYQHFSKFGKQLEKKYK